MAGYTRRERQCYLSVLLVVTLLGAGCAHPFRRASQDVDRDLQVVETRTQDTTAPARNKRWDYGADACHCNDYSVECLQDVFCLQGYSVECLQDVFCQRKQKSNQWICQMSCCGFKCVSKN